MSDSTQKTTTGASPLFLSPKRDSVLFLSMMRHTADAVYFKDRESRFIAISQAQAHRYHLADPAEAIGKTDFDFFSIEHAQQAFDDEQEIMRTGTPVLDKEEKLTWPDGRITWSSSTKLPLVDLEGKVVGTFGISRDITERKLIQEKLRESLEEIKRHSEAMQHDLERARVIQDTLLPERAPNHPRLKIDYRYNPLETVGGDYYQFFPLGADMTGLFIGDLTGHGVSAALFMALVKFLTDRLSKFHGAYPRQFLETLNHSLLDQMPSSFITAGYGVFRFDESGRAFFVYADAGHPSPLLHRRRENRIELMPQNGMGALGVLDEFKTDTFEVELEPGDRLFFYTDGISETSNPAHEMLGEEALPELIIDNTRPGLSDTLDEIILTVDRFRAGRSVEDDILLIGCEIQ